MVSSPAPALPSRRTRHLWLTALALAILVLALPLVLVARINGTAAAVYGLAAVVVLVLLNKLRERHRSTESEVARCRGEIREREKEAAGREANWHEYVEGHAELLRQEIEFVVETRVPAALNRSQIPPSLHSAEELGDTVTDGLERLVSEISAAVDNRDESQRLSLVELASRVQTSAHRIQATVTGLADRYPSDADLLEATMRVDHAATQQARHAQSLKVLCDEWPGQQWQKPLALVDVVRAASGRIVAYQRIVVSGDPDVGIIAPVVEPLIHLMAELLANATEYSPPKTGVPVTVRTVQRGAVIEVDDGGLGLDEYRLSGAREIVSGRRLLGVGEVGEIPQTGFAVVGRFAHRHGFGVDLGPSPYGGVRAVVLVPTDVLETLAPAGTPVRRSTGAHASPAASERAVPSQAAPSEPAAAFQPAASLEPAAPQPVAPPATAHSAGPPAVAAPPAPALHVVPRPAVPSVPAASGGLRRLPQRRSRRDEYGPAVPAAPTAATPPGSPEEAGDWMEQFLGGSRPVPLSGSTPGTDRGSSSSGTSEPPSREGQA